MQNTTYWFARGYHDGRSIGVHDDALRNHITEECSAAYTRGYDTGVTDYCNLDINKPQ